MVSTTDDNMTELSEYVMVVIASTDQPNAVEIGLSNVSFITIKDNNLCSIQSMVSTMDCMLHGRQHNRAIRVLQCDDYLH